MGQEEDDLEETTGGGFKRGGKFKGFIKKKVVKFKEGRTQEAKLAKIASRKKILEARQELLSQRQKIATQRQDIARQRAELRKTQLKGTGINVPKFVRGTQELSSFAFGGGEGVGISSGFEAIAGKPQPVASVPRKFRTVKSIKRIRIKSGKRKGKFRTTTTRKRVALGQAAQPKPFDPFSQF